MKKNKFISLISTFVIFLIFGIFAFLSYTNKISYKQGLDLRGGAQLVFSIDTNAIKQEDLQDTLNALRDTIERRVNIFGVSEPSVYLEQGSIVSDKKDKYRLVVELPGVVNPQEAAEKIGKTPVLEFKMRKEDGAYEEKSIITGKHIKDANLIFISGIGSIGSEPAVELVFNKEGGDIFADITKNNVGKVFGIFLDGKPISEPVIREAIYGGKAVISGSFSVQEAKKLAREISYGALPAPVSLVNMQKVGASLGRDSLQKSIYAGMIGFALVAIFLVIYYRLLGVLALFSLSFYVVFVLALFKLLGVTITAPGLAGFVLSVGMAVDANILIFERIKEELKDGKKIKQAIENGFARAWNSIRDGNLSSLITAIVLFWMGTSIIKGFALVFAIGVIASMISSIVVSRILINAILELFNKYESAR